MGKLISCPILPCVSLAALCLPCICVFPSSSLFCRNSRVLSSYSCFCTYYKIGNVKGIVKKYLQKNPIQQFHFDMDYCTESAPPLSLVRCRGWNPGRRIHSTTELHSQLQRSTVLLNWLRDSFRGKQDGSLSKSSSMWTRVQIHKASVKCGTWSCVPGNGHTLGRGDESLTGACWLPAYL